MRRHARLAGQRRFSRRDPAKLSSPRSDSRRCPTGLHHLRLAVSKKLPLFAAALLAACGGHGGSTSGTTGSSTGGPASTSGGQSTGAASSGLTGSSGATRTSGSASSTAAASSGESGSAVSSSTSGGSSSSAIAPCGLGAVWQGESCVLQGCVGAPVGQQCQLPDGGVGWCGAGECNEIGSFDIQPSCADAGCPAGRECLPGAEVCLRSSCNAATTDQSCLVGATVGFCCGDQCLVGGSEDGGAGSSNCGACGRSCGDAGACLFGLSCVQTSPCSAGLDNFVCRLPGGQAGLCCEGSCQDPAVQVPPNCGVCGLGCASCQSDSDCPSGQACAVPSETGSLSAKSAGACASISCTGSADGLACAIPGVVERFEGVWGNEVVATECCGGACLDLEYDSSNCGACGLTCPVGTVCQFGSCEPVASCGLAAPGTSCPLSAIAEGICCGGECVDPAGGLNCRACGLTCPQGTICAAGECAMPDGGEMVPPSAPSACVGLVDGSPCGPAGGGSPYYCCAGACVTYSGINFSTCAACGFACPACGPGCPGGTACVNNGGAAVCLPLRCSPGGNGDGCAFGPQGLLLSNVFPGASLYPGYLSHGSSTACCSEACVDLTQDPNNCGDCGIACPSGICAHARDSFAACFPSQPDTDCLETCGPWAVCVRGTCVDSSCETSPYCAAQDGAVGVCCSASVEAPISCADLANDTLNCGGCGVKCPPGLNCSQGVCTGTPPDCAHRLGGFCNLDAGLNYLCCPGVGCTDTTSDAANCGTCGIVCLAGMSCQDGSCI